MAIVSNLPDFGEHVNSLIKSGQHRNYWRLSALQTVVNRTIPAPVRLNKRMSSPAITLHEPPTPVKFFRETAILLTIAFSGDPIDRWCSVNGDEPIMEKEEDIPDDHERTFAVSPTRNFAPTLSPSRLFSMVRSQELQFGRFHGVTGDTKASHNLFTAKPSSERTR
jgi:hypothetical protein